MSQEILGGMVDVELGEAKFEGFIGRTPSDSVDIDPSRPNFDDHTNRMFWGVMGSTRLGNRPDMLERRTALAGLMSEYRRKLADLSKQQGPNADPMERSAARREIRAWYIARRRAIHRGTLI